MFSFLNKNKKTDNADLALKLFETLSVSTSNLTNSEEKTINLILKKCNSRQDILNKVIEMCGAPITSKQRYIYAAAYAWSTKEYREKAIYYLELYLSNPLYEDIYLHRFRFYEQSIESRKNDHLTTMYKYLAEIYEKEYIFDKALYNYEKMIEINPYNPGGYNGKVNVLIKMNKIDMALEFLQDVKKSKFYAKNKEYSPDNWLMKDIDNLICECIEKKNKNYMYKPRNKK